MNNVIPVFTSTFPQNKSLKQVYKSLNTAVCEIILTVCEGMSISFSFGTNKREQKQKYIYWCCFYFLNLLWCTQQSFHHVIRLIDLLKLPVPYNHSGSMCLGCLLILNFCQIAPFSHWEYISTWIIRMLHYFIPDGSVNQIEKRQHPLIALH